MAAQNILRTNEVKYVFSEENKIGFDYSFDVTKCLQQLEIPDLFHMCAPCSELPSDIRTMVRLKYTFCI